MKQLEIAVKICAISLIIYLVIFGLLFPVYGLGKTPVTIESLAYHYSNNYRGLNQWMAWNVRYVEDDGACKDMNSFIQSGEGDCDEFAVMRYEVLRRGNTYKPIVILLPKQKHALCAIKEDGNYILLDVDKIIATEYTTFDELNEKMFGGNARIAKVHKISYKRWVV